MMKHTTAHRCSRSISTSDVLAIRVNAPVRSLPRRWYAAHARQLQAADEGQRMSLAGKCGATIMQVYS